MLCSSRLKVTFAIYLQHFSPVYRLLVHFENCSPNRFQDCQFEIEMLLSVIFYSYNNGKTRINAAKIEVNSHLPRKKTRFRAIALQNWFVWYPFRYFNNWLLMLPERFSDRCRDLYGCQLFPLIPKRIQSIENINETKSSLRRCYTLPDSPLLSVRLYYVGNNISNIISLENGFSVKVIA